MLDYKFAVPIYIFILVGSIWSFFRAEKYLYGNEELFMYTPEHDVENVKRKHKKIWHWLFVFSFFPIVLFVVDVFFALLASKSMYEVYNLAKLLPLVWILGAVWVLPANRYGRIIRELESQGKTVGRYMVYPRPDLLATLMCTILFTVVAIICSIMVILLETEIDTLGKYAFIVVFAETIILLYLANYSIIRYYYNAPRELVLGETTESDYDAVAKRYYGIWRNRLIIANVVTGAQLILGGFVTLTNAGDDLMGIRILGLALLVIVFSYILIQSREFEDPVVVRGMVYPSERKRITLKWVILSAIAVYALGAIVLL